MNESQHPDHVVLNAYAHQPDADEFRQVSLHLLHCKQCRDEVSQSNRLKSDFSLLQSEHCTDEQQRVVDDFLYNENCIAENNNLKQRIRNNPQSLKSVLFSLSHIAQQKETSNDSQPAKVEKPSKSWMALITDWLHWQTSTWATAGIAAVVTLTLTVFILQQHSLAPDATESISIASYQDNNVIRFFPRDQLPGIGFFNGAMQSSQPFQNMQISSDNNQVLELSWTPVKSASVYELNLYRFTRGEKKLLETFKTDMTRSHYQLSADDYNQRFEWVLSGHTLDDKTFVTSGGFVVQKTPHGGDL